MLPEETHYLKTMSGSRVLCQNTSTFEPQFDIDLAGDLSLDILSTIIDAGFVRVAVAAVGLGCGEGPFKFLSANHASYSCKKVLKALLESSEASTNERSKGVHCHAAKELAEIVVIMLKTGAIRQPPFLDLLHFIASLQAFSELQKALMKCEYLNILSDAAIYDAVFPVMNLSEISPQSPHFFTHVGKLRVVSSKPRFSFFSAEQSTKAAVLCSRGKTSEQTHTKRSSSNNLPEKHIMSPPRKFPRSLKRSFEVFSKKTAVRCCRASQLRSAFGFFSEEVGENIFMSDFPNALAHGRRYRFVNSTAPDTCAGQRKACNVARKAPNSSKCWSSIATGQSPRSKREPSKFSPFMQLSLFALVSEFAIHCQVMHATHPFEAPMIPKTIARAFSTVSASLYFEHQPFKCCGDHPYLEEVNARAYLPKLLKDSSFYSLDLFLARLRGHSDSLWMSCVFWGELSARHCLTLEWLLVTLTSYLENAPALYGRDTTISIEILIHIRFLLSAALSSSVKTCNKSSLWGIICLWIRAACVINTQIAQTRSSPSLAQMMTKLFLGEHGSISLVQKYMDVALADFESKRRPSGINYEDTHSSDLNPCYVVKSYFTSITQLYLILHSNATSEDNHEFQHSDQRHLSAILIMLARLKCIFEPRSGLATRKYEDIMDPCVGTLTYPNRICLGDHMCINSLALAQVTLSTLFYLNVDSPESLFAYFHVIFISFLHSYITRFKNIPLDQPGCDELIAKHLILLTSLTRILKSEGMDTLHKSGFHSVSSLNRLCGRSRVSKTCVCSTTQKPVGNYTTCSDYVIQHHLAKFVINEIGLEHDIFHQQALRVKSARMDRCHAPGGINKVLNSKVTDIVDLFHMTRKDPQKASADVKFLKGTELSEIPLSCSPYEVLTYFVGRKLRRLYDAHRIHIHVLELVLATFATSTRGNILWNEIPARKCTSVQLQDWTEAGYRSLRSHVNCRANASAQNLLLSHRHVLSWDEIRLLRISCESLFEPSKYTSLELIGRGSYADVYHCSLSLELKVDTWNDAAAKVFESSGQWQTSSVFSEIQVLEEMQKEAFVVKLCDYGIAFGHAFIIMRQYPASLKCWRASQNYSIEAGNMCLPIQLHLNVFSLCVDAVCALSDFGVVHYDIKADNFLLEPETSCSVKDFWDPSQERWNEVPPFRVLISDFGESRRYAGLHNAGTLHSHGTEYIKAPEMLMISKIASIDGETPDRRNCSDCGDRVDAWALGCLLFEILANEYMLYDVDWIRFFLRTVTQGVELIPQKSLHLLDYMPVIKSFVLWILVRDPRGRPDVTQIRGKLSAIKAITFGKMKSRQCEQVGSLSTSLSTCNWKYHRSQLPLLQGQPAAALKKHYIGLKNQQNAEDRTVFHLQNDSFTLAELRYALTFVAMPRLEILDISEALHISFHESCFDAILVCGKERVVDTCGNDDLKNLEYNDHVKLYRRAISCGIAVQIIKLPNPMARGHDVQLHFSAILNSGVSFGRRIRWDPHAKLAIVCEPADVSVAAAVAIAIQVDMSGDDVRSNMFRCSNAGACDKMHATDLARLCAWESRSRTVQS